MGIVIGIGDIHGDPIWKDIVNKEVATADKIVFVGDYFDSEIYTTEQQCNNFLDIIAFKKANPEKVELLWGNHDDHYRNINSLASGHQAVGRFQIEELIKQNIDLFKVAYQYDNLLFSHAGICPTFLNWIYGIDGWNTANLVEKLNETFKYKPLFLQFNGSDQYGDDIGQTPIWIRPRSLMVSNVRSQIKKNFVQIVGHTRKTKLDIGDGTIDKKYYFIDTLNSAKQYLYYKNGKFEARKVEFKYPNYDSLWDEYSDYMM